MITEIKKIHGIGRYEKFDGPLEIHKNQVFFGFNGSGKSTLSDIFYSFSDENMKNLIMNRRTLIREHGESLCAPEVVFKTDGEDLIFENENWNRSEPVVVFNDHYLEQYLFLGKDYTENGRVIRFGKREKELAEQVDRLNEMVLNEIDEISGILSNNKMLCEKLGLGKNRISTSNWKKRIEVISGITFFALSDKDSIARSLEKEKKQDERLVKINQWKDSLTKFSFLFDSGKLSAIRKMSDWLKEVPRVTGKEVLDHVEHSMVHKDINWLAKGKTYQKDSKVCPFCGQEISGKEYSQFSKKLDKYILGKQKVKADRISNEMRKLGAFFDVSEWKAFFVIIDGIIEDNSDKKILRKKVVTDFEKLQLPKEDVAEYVASLRKKADMKADNPHMELLLSGEEKKVCSTIVRVIERIRKIVEGLDEEHELIEKRILSSKEYEKKVALFEASYGENADNIREMVTKSKKVLEKEQQRDRCQREIDKLVDETRLQPVNAFLEEINANFRVKIIDNAYYVQINGFQPTPYEKENKILCSEGERRMLAFAYFLQDIEVMQGEKIIVVDDPISSLDINRKSVVAYKVVELMKKTENQVIVLSHDISFIEKIDFLSHGLSSPLDKLEIQRGNEPFKELDIYEYIISDECVYEQIIRKGETSSNLNDKIIAWMALRPYSYLKTHGIFNGAEIYEDIRNRSTYFAHSLYSHNKSIKYTKGKYSTRLLKTYCRRVQRATRLTLNIERLIPNEYTFTGFDIESAWNLYEAISLESVLDFRRKALVLRVVLETCLFALIDKGRLDPEHVGDAYKAAASKAGQITRNELVKEQNEYVLRLYKLYDFSKKYHHGADGGSTLGLSSLNVDEMIQFDKEIHEIHEWIIMHPERVNVHLKNA